MNQNKNFETQATENTRSTDLQTSETRLKHLKLAGRVHKLTATVALTGAAFGVGGAINQEHEADRTHEAAVVYAAQDDHVRSARLEAVAKAEEQRAATALGGAALGALTGSLMAGASAASSAGQRQEQQRIDELRSDQSGEPPLPGEPELLAGPHEPEA